MPRRSAPKPVEVRAGDDTGMSLSDFWRGIVRLPGPTGRLVAPTPHAEQAKFLKAFDELETDGNRRYSEFFLWWAKKSAKSFTAAVALLHHVVADPLERNERRAVIGASDQDQGTKIIFRQCRELVERNEFLSRHVQVLRNELIFREVVVDPRTGGRYTREHRLDAPANDPKGQTGEEYSFRVIDEVWTATGYDLLESLILSPTRPNGATIYLSYHGLRSMQRAGVPVFDLIERVKSGDPHLWASYIGGEGERASWRIVPWIKPAWIESQRRQFATVPSKFKRTVLNLPAGPDAGLLSDEELKAAQFSGPEPASALPGVTYVGTLDLGLSRDWAAFSIGHLHDGVATVDVVRFWRGTRQKPIDLQDVEDTILDFHARFKFRLIADQWQAAFMIQRLQRRRVAARTVVLEASRLDRIVTILKGAFSGRLVRINAAHVEFIEQLESIQTTESVGRGRRDLTKFIASGSGPDAGQHDDLVIAAGLLLEELSERGTRLGAVTMAAMTECLREAYFGAGTVSCYLFDRGNALPVDPVCRQCPGHQSVRAAHAAFVARTGENVEIRTFYRMGMIRPNNYVSHRRANERLRDGV